MAVLAGFGRCYAKERRPESLSLIATQPTSRREVEVYRKLFSRDGIDCLHNMTLSFPLALVRGAIAEGLYVAGEGVPAEYRQSAPTVGEVRNLSDAARCYAAGHRKQVETLLATKPGSKKEFQAIDQLINEFAACMPPGVQARFDPTVVRFRLAEALLRLTPTATAASGSSN